MSRVMPPDTVDLPESLRQCELQIAREIARAFLTATRPLEVYRLALARVTSLVGASFSSVFVRDAGDPSLLRLVCAQNWPQASARFLGQLRIRVGRGPTGRAVAEGMAFEVEDVFAEPGLREWWQPARELGFTSLMSLPLRNATEVAGALTFYFEGRRSFEPGERALLATVTDQLAATAERAALIERLQASNARLEREKAELEGKLGEAERSHRGRMEKALDAGEAVREALAVVVACVDMLADDAVGRMSGQQRATVRRIGDAAEPARRLLDDLVELSRIELGRVAINPSPQRAVDLARSALEAVWPAGNGRIVRVEPDVGGPAILVDGEKITRILTSLLAYAVAESAPGELVMAVRHAPLIVPSEGRHTIVEWTLAHRAAEDGDTPATARLEETTGVEDGGAWIGSAAGVRLSLARAVAQLVGGEIVSGGKAGEGSCVTLRLEARIA